ncbi:ROK family transcriptional regulator [Gordonia shandongensis]|uniref:ROK family transcriptional regulator n=1 Tax=Gordonia shandongensis TaxID=376351 RepID=UPI0003F88936|nr:ROK family transcriptional regulator [Gordonia shandongensis]
MNISGVVVAHLRVGSGPAAAVLGAVRAGAPLTRDRIVDETGLSAATINRQVNALLDAGLLVERADLLGHAGVGRPKLPLTLDADRFCVAGMHVGARRTALVIADVAGRTLYSHAIRTRELAGAEPAEAVARLCDLLAELAARFSGRRVLWGGAALGGVVDSETGVVSHPILGWEDQPLGERLTAALGVPVSVAEHVQAMAAAELLLSSSIDDDGSTLFFYARETVGMSLIIGGEVHQPAGGAGTVAGLRVAPGVLDVEPIAPLQPVIGTAAVKAAAARLGVDHTAGVIADDRARVLGEAVATMRDVLNPDQVIVAGEAFSAHPHGLAPVQAAFDAASLLPGALEIVPTCFGIAAPEASAVAVALSAVYGDPLGVAGD